MSTCRSSLKNDTYEFVFASLSVPTCLIRVTEKGDRWPDSSCFVGCCFHNLFKTPFLRCSHEVFFVCFLLTSMWCIHIAVWTQAWLGRNSILFHWIDQTSIWPINCPLYSASLIGVCWRSVEEILLLRYVNWFINSRDLLLRWNDAFLFKMHVLCFICIH